MIDSRNSDLPKTTSVIADGFPGIILLVQGTDIQLCEATDISIQQQTCNGFQLVFEDLPVLQCYLVHGRALDGGRCYPSGLLRLGGSTW